MLTTSRVSHKKSWQTGRTRVSVLAEMALRKEKLAARLEELRESNSLTQEQAAARVGVTLRQWQRWEAGESVPYPRNLEQIANHFGLSINEFFDETHRSSLVDRVEELTGTVEELTRRLAALEFERELGVAAEHKSRRSGGTSSASPRRKREG